MKGLDDSDVGEPTYGAPTEGEANPLCLKFLENI